MPNAIAYLILMLWPVVCLVLFRTVALERALVWSILGGYLILPPLAEFNLPLVPAMDKVSIPNLSVLLILGFGMRTRLRLWPRARSAGVLVGLFLLCAIPTVVTNGDPLIFRVLAHSDPIVFRTDELPGLSLRDVGSVLINQALMIVPFLLARQFLATERGLRELLLALMVGGAVYALPALVEIRFSPQINVWVYGFFQHSFEQMMREGGFRPIVFLPHALWLALFFVMSLFAALTLARTAPPRARWKYIVTALYLAGVLFLCKSLASFAYAVVLAPLVLFAPPRWLIRVAALFAVIAVIYPMLRNAGLVPLDDIVAQAQAISAERAQSLEYRFDNEQALLARAAEKPLFGWGGWGRNLIRHSETAQILSIPDGRWIIVFGTFGWLGYIAEFGLLTLPLVLLALRTRGARAVVSPHVAAVAMILGITMMDMLLNATLTPITWLAAGAVLGHAERLAPDRRAARYRFRIRPAMGQGTPRATRRTLL